MKKGRVIENDIYRPEEYQSFEEYQHFEAEQYRPKETVRVEMEDFKSEEYKKTSFVEDIKTKDKEEKDDKLSKKIKEKIINNTSGTTAASASVSGTVFIAAAGIGAIIIGLPLIPNIGAIDYGEIAFKSHHIDIDYKDDIQINNLFIYFDSYLKEDFDAYINYENVTYEPLIDNNINYFYIPNIRVHEVDEVISFPILIKKGEKIIDELSYEINLKNNQNYIGEIRKDSFVTFNDDDTSNVYIRPDFSLLNNFSGSLTHNIYLKDKTGNILRDYDFESTYDSNSNFISILNIPDQSYSVHLEIVTSDENNNTYTVARFKTDYFYTSTLDSKFIEHKVEDNYLHLASNLTPGSDIDVSITYLEDNFVETHQFGATAYRDINIPLTRETSEITYSVTAMFSPYEDYELMYFNPSYKGTANKTLTCENTASVEYLYPSLELTRFEIFQRGSYKNASMYFDGFIPDDCVLTVDIYDSNLELNTSLTSYEYTIEIIGEFLESEIYTFDYYLLNESDNVVDESTRGQFESVLFHNHYATDIGTIGINPSDAYITLNEDDRTFNAYFHTNYVNNSSYDKAYYKVDAIHGKRVDIFTTTNSYLAIEDMDTHFSIKACVYIQDETNPLIHYALVDEYYPSGVVGELFDSYKENGYLPGYEGYCEPTETQFVYDITVYLQIHSDVTIEFLDTNENIMIYVVNQSEITYSSEENMSSFTLDLRGQNAFEDEYIEMTCLCDISTSVTIEDRINIIQNMTPKGVPYVTRVYDLLI